MNVITKGSDWNFPWAYQSLVYRLTFQTPAQGLSLLSRRTHWKWLEDHRSSVPAQQNPLTLISINIMQISAVWNKSKLAKSTGNQELAFDSKTRSLLCKDVGVMQTLWSCLKRLHRVDGNLTKANRNVTCSNRYEKKFSLDITQQSWACQFIHTHTMFRIYPR